MIVLPRSDMPSASVVMLGFRDAEGLRHALASVAAHAGSTPYEVVVVLNDASPPVQELVRRGVEGARVVESSANLGFGGGCNAGAAVAAGEHLVFLNDDARVEPGWLDALVRTAGRRPDGAAVGSRHVGPDGRLVEAGQIVWRDGSTLAAGVGAAADDPAYDYVREVDYCSAASLLVRREDFEAVGGFDERYYPAYFEDADLCLQLRERGRRVLYEPRSTILHHWGDRPGWELASFLYRRNQERFRERWAERLAAHDERRGDDPASIRRALLRARGRPPRLLVVDDLLSTEVGAGYGRMLEALEQLGRRYALALHPRHPSATADPGPLADLEVEVVPELEPHLRQPDVLYDAVLVSRPAGIPAELELVRRLQPQAALVYDCEALAYRRAQRQARHAETAEARRFLEDEAERLRALEESVPRTVDRVTCVSEEEAELLRAVPGACPVDVPSVRSVHAEPTWAPFAERRGAVLVASWLAGPKSQNADGLAWLAEEVLPHVVERAPWLTISVTGGNLPAEVRALERPGLRFVGHVDDLRELYEVVRVALVPLRWGAGVKIKAVEALQHGVPVLATSAGAEGCGFEDVPTLAPVDDPAAFAQRLVSLATEPDAWAAARADVLRLRSRWSAETPPSWLSVLSAARTRRRDEHVA